MASDPIKTLSTIIGWTYMLCWTASCYPQFLLNIRRRTTAGFSIDFALLNILGMTSYAIHNLVLFFSPVVRAQYAHRYPRSPTPTVQPNDIAYAVHGCIITVLVYSQFYPGLWRFARARDLRCSPWTLGFFWGCIGLVLLGAFVVGLRPASFRWEWLDVIYLLGNVKTFLTVVKYAPQIWLNIRRKSTRGLSISQFTLDLTGAVLSLAQLFLDASRGGDWSAVLANPAKFALGNVTVFFDLVAFFQHYYLYRGAVDDALPADKLDAEREPLLSSHASRTTLETS
ncbi:putative lysosomal cystine transporter [Diaporthe ampelina]|uniref:Putative lysosomal cystine transporter n=1 Tax=Diaporthe ampelina TaxID=1214573 RepID=A0A0G2H7I5_9PEZI|nr:putative lysosomal cystine transporter [Diaporthe ampelina]